MKNTADYSISIITFEIQHPAIKHMKKIRILKVSFDTKIAKHEIPAFRGAFVDKIGNDHLLFHNHISDTELLYKYPPDTIQKAKG